MIFRQLFEPVSSTYTYLLGCEQIGQAILIDPVLPTWQRDLAEINALGLKLAYTVDTHIHADHLTAARKLKQEAGSRIAHPALDQLSCADAALEDGKPFTVGSITLAPLHTPGHTDHHFAYAVDGRVLTGDALLIDGCGRTDFQNGDAPTLYRSVHDKLFTLAEDTLVYPAHDYQGRRVSSIGQEKTRNPRLGDNKPLVEFVGIMANLKLAYPKFIDYAVPGNRECGQCPPGVPEDLQQYCEQVRNSHQG
ncbi:metallo-beta-lactamase family protein [Sulfuriferula multivorans]|uniref:Metallo-beta-lactamase family protein n=1 Tax=Sulfuriferula multivorans TaxID=1559896 RepID=A0A401JA41_9PROT|nr:MBL fold metallo-hydrolase [Sulfuriferula multivorans]GBL44416.1 metallo-beta-lactamase family protein [Sulfuriferula multivorans]